MGGVIAKLEVGLPELSSLLAMNAPSSPSGPGRVQEALPRLCLHIWEAARGEHCTHSHFHLISAIAAHQIPVVFILLQGP